MRRLLISFLLVGCFDAGSAPLICSQEMPQCPDGRSCVDGQCVTVGASDGGSGDLATNDMQQADLLPVSGCAAGNGKAVGAGGAWACPGVYGGVNPKASTLCRSKVCSDASLLMESDCALVDGFFVSSTWGATSMLDPPEVICNSAASLELAFFGCGKLGFKTTMQCSGFNRSMQVSIANKLMASNPYSINSLSNSDPNNGVLCCP